MSADTRKRRMIEVARSDRTFERFDDEGGLWRGKCLICNGHLKFSEDARVHDREATVEHILARANGGDPVAIENLAIVHPRCNNEKGRRTDVLGPGHPKHQQVVERMQSLRRRRWRTSVVDGGEDD